MDLSGQSFLIVGMGKSGISACKILSRMGADVYVSDLGPAEKIISENHLQVKDFESGINTLQFLDCCDKVIVSPGISPEIPLIKEAIARGIPVQNEVDFSSEFFQFPVIGITGTNGKTTTTALIKEILVHSGKNSFAGGNIGIPAVERILETNWDYGVLEISSYMLETCEKLKPYIGIVLNLTEDHLTRHHTMENYLNVKLSLSRRQDSRDHFILNLDDEILSQVDTSVFPGNLWWFSRKQRVKQGCFVEQGKIYFTEGTEEIFISEVSDIRIPGTHNLENVLAACLATFLAGVNPNQIAETLKTFSGVEHRLELVTIINEVEYINDSKGTNPDASIKGIQAMSRPVILIAGGYDKKIDLSPFIQTIEEQVESVILIGEVRKIIYDSLKDKSKAFLCENLEEAVLRAKSISCPGDCVLFSPACASFDMYQNFEERGAHFKKIVRELI